MEKIEKNLEDKLNNLANEIIKKMIKTRFTSSGLFRHNEFYFSIIKNKNNIDDYQKIISQGLSYYLKNKYKDNIKLVFSTLPDKNVYRISIQAFEETKEKEIKTMTNILTDINQFINAYNSLKKL